MTKTFEYTAFIGADATRVWNALISVEEAAQYYMCPMTEIELNIGGIISYGEGMIHGKIVTLEESSLLRHTFSFGDRADEPESEVTYSLEAIGEVTRLTVVHEGLIPDSDTCNDIVDGWPVIMSQLKTYLETGKKLPWPKK